MANAIVEPEVSLGPVCPLESCLQAREGHASSTFKSQVEEGRRGRGECSGAWL